LHPGASLLLQSQWPFVLRKYSSFRQQKANSLEHFFYYNPFFGGREFVGHFAYVAHLRLFRNVKIRTQKSRCAVPT
jgi:hypothetical protein